jgi:hypothetical protein
MYSNDDVGSGRQAAHVAAIASLYKNSH